MNPLIRKVRLLEKAWNEGDTETMLSLYTDDIVLSCNGRVTADGKEGMALLLEMDVAAGCEIAFSNIVVLDDDALACTVTERNDFFRLFGLGEFRKINIVRFRDGLICEETEACDVGQWQAMRSTMHALYEAVFEWAAQERPDVLAEIRPGGELVQSKECTTKLLALCREWKQATGEGA